MENLIDQEEIKIVYLGAPVNDIIVSSISLFEFHAKNDYELTKLSKKISLIIAECFQNVSHHNIQPNETQYLDTKNFFQIQIQKQGVSISSKNIVKQDDIETLNDKIDLVNSLNKSELKMLWEKTIQEGEFTNKGGAGLGIIEMGRKSDLPIQKKFVLRNEKISDFFMSVSIPKKDYKKDLFYLLQKAEDASNRFIDENIIIYYQGILSSNTSTSLIDILNFNFIHENHVDSTRNRIIPVTVKMLENAAKYGAKISNQNKGLFSVANHGELLKISCCNLILNEKIPGFKKEIETIKNMSLNALEDEHKNRLLNQELEQPTNKNTHLGLIEIAIATNNKFDHAFSKIDETLSYFKIELVL